MSDDYKYKNLPRAANGIAPAQWDEKKKEWVPYDGINDVNIKNLKEVTDEINNIKVTQDKILERLNKPLDTQVTGSIDKYELPVKIESNVEIINVFKGVEIPPGGTVRLDPSINIYKFSDILVQFRSGGSAIGFESYQIDSLWHQGNSRTPAFEQNIIDETNKTSNVSSEWVSVMGVKTTISVKNRMEEEKSFSDLTVIGRRL